MTDDARPTTITDVAVELGVSIATVSRALTRPELLSQQTRARVLEGIERLGYQPNLLARDLRLRESKVAFVIVPSLSPFFLEVFRGVEKAARKTGYSVLMGHTDRDPAREQVFFDQVAARRADGIILVTSSRASAIVSRKQRLPPIVAALEQIDGRPLPTVRVDHTAAAVAATEYLLELGHRRVAHISGPMISPMAVHRLEGYQQAMGPGFDAGLCIEGDFTIRSGELAMGLLLGRQDPPTAVFAGNDEMAIGAVRAVKSAGLRVPEDISIIGFDDQRIAGLYDPPLTTVHVPTAEIGYRSMLLLERVLAHSAADRDIVLPTKITVRATTAPCKTRRDRAAPST
jgi:LacI family repressor for deo operon, udp, cdd, tsx, nupC, and nupG